MKLVVFIGLCLVATTFATPLSSELRLRRQAVTTANPECPTETGLGGLVGQVGNLLGNVLDNVGRLRVRTLLTGDTSLLNQLPGLLMQVQQLLNDLLGNSNGSDTQGLLGNLLGDITELVNSILGNTEANSWPCTRSNGVLGRLLTSAIGAVGNLTGITSNDGGLLTEVLTVVLRLVSSLLGLLL